MCGQEDMVGNRDQLALCGGLRLSKGIMPLLGCEPAIFSELFSGQGNFLVATPGRHLVSSVVFWALVVFWWCVCGVWAFWVVWACFFVDSEYN